MALSGVNNVITGEIPCSYIIHQVFACICHKHVTLKVVSCRSYISCVRNQRSINRAHSAILL